MRMRIVRAALCAAVLTLPFLAQASSHREAPFIAKNPAVDGTDFYMFRSYETGRAAFVTIVANYLPLQDAYGGPNYFNLDPNALYEIMIDNTGDGIEDLTFQFQFQQALADSGAGIGLPIAGGDGGTIAVPFTNVGNIATAANLNVIQTYSVNMVTGPRRTGTSATVSNAANASLTFTKPADNIGVSSFPGGYQTYAGQYLYSITIPGCTTPGNMFVGQRAESFAVNLGPVFDLVDIPASTVAGGAPNKWGNPLAKKNITSIALELPISCITQNSTQPIIGGWTTASVRQARVVNPGATYTVPTHEGGAWTQVSRLSNPLVNELVIGLPDKDHFNSSSPKDDAQFAKYVEYPTLPAILDELFGPGIQPLASAYPRLDMVEAFLTGVPGVNKFTGGATVEMLRLNTSLAATAVGAQSYLGAALCVTNGTVNTSAAGCDVGGFPNGRRPGDDVVDIALDVMMGFLLPGSEAPLYNNKVTALTDGVQQLASQFDATFPYLKTPTQGANGDGT